MTYREVIKATRLGGFASSRIEDDGAVDSALLRHWASQANLLHGYKGQAACFAFPIKFDPENGLYRYNHGTIKLSNTLTGGVQIVIAVFDVPLNPFWNKINAKVFYSAKTDMLIRVGDSTYRQINQGSDQVVDFLGVAPTSLDFSTIYITLRNPANSRYSFRDDGNGSYNSASGVYTNTSLAIPALGGFPYNANLFATNDGFSYNGTFVEVVVTSATTFQVIGPGTSPTPLTGLNSDNADMDLVPQPEMTFHSITIWGEA